MSGGESEEARLDRELTVRNERRGLGAIGAVAAVLTVLAVALVRVIAAQDRAPEGPDEASLEAVAVVAVTDRGHVETDVEYASVPPVGGDHAPIWQDCAAYATPVLDELAVHSLEHRGVWLAYDPALPEPDRAALDVRAGYVLVSPVEEAVAPVVAVAWGLRLELEGVDDPRLEAFVNSYAEGPQTLEPGAPCSGGYSEAA